MKIYDLSVTLKKGLWYYGSPYVPFDLEVVANVKDNGYIARKLTMTTHTGTHIECAAHWWDDGEGIDQTDLSKLVGKSKVIRLNSNSEPFFQIDKDTLIKAGAEKLEPGDICIISTQWEHKINDDNYTSESPYITVDAAEYLVSKKIKLMATDFPMCGDPRDGIDFVPDDLILPDYVLLENGIPYLLGLVNLDLIPDEVFFAGFPLKIEGGDGSPVRAVAWEIP